MNNPKILVVDDEPFNVDYLEQELEDLDYSTVSAFNGREALAQVEAESPDVILLDIMMPVMDGFQVLEHLKANEQWRNIPVIIISALTDMDSVVRGIKLGAEEYLPKPFNEVLLQARLEASLEKKRFRDKEQAYLAEIEAAHQEISLLNERLAEENLRLGAELAVAQRLQQILLPKPKELTQVAGLDIAAYMKTADEVGGDYYDVLQHNGTTKIGIGDVTGHGLESGIVMLMTQTAVRTLLNSGETEPVHFLDTLNRTVYDNVQRMGADKNLSLSLLDYTNGRVTLSGQHEALILVRANGEVTLIDTVDLGFPIGLDDNIADFIDQTTIDLHAGDGIVLYTDGITEAENEAGQQYELERLCTIVGEHWSKSSIEIQEAVLTDVVSHIGEHKMYDDITLLVVKQK